MRLSADFPKVVIDQSAETIRELFKDWPKGLDSLQEFAKSQTDAGAWERVWKRVGNRLYPAYRRRKR